MSEIYRIVLTERFKNGTGYRVRGEVTSEEFIDLLREGELKVTEETDFIEVGVRIYELGEETPPTSYIGFIRIVNGVTVYKSY